MERATELLSVTLLKHLVTRLLRWNSCYGRHAASWSLLLTDFFCHAASEEGREEKDEA
jgi:hypothetical protein